MNFRISTHYARNFFIASLLFVFTTAFGQNFDQGGNITLSVSDGSGAHLHWSTGNFCDEIIVGEGNNYTIPAPTTTTTYFAYWEDASGCRSVCDNYAVVVYPVDASGMDITSIESPYCKNDPNDDVFGIYNYGYLNKVFTLTPASGGFSDNGDGSATISPTAMAQNTYIMTYTVSIDNCQHSTTAPFVINPPLIIDFAITTPVCSNALPQLLTGSEAPEGHFSGPGITDYGDGTAEFDPGAAGPGTHTITYTYTDPDECFATVSHDVVVFDDPIVSFATLNAHYCAGDPPVNLIGNQAPLGSFTITPVTVIAPDFADNGNGTANFNPNGATTGPGTYSITYEYTDGNSCYGSETQTTEVHAILTPTITGDATPCQNIDLIYTTEAGMNNYNWVVSAGGTVVSGGTTSDNTITINWGSTGPQTLQITYDNSNGGCTSNTVTLNLNVLAQPSASLAPFSNVCLDDAAFLLSGGTASPGGGTEIYDVDGVPTVIFDPSVIGSVPDPHVITYTYIAPNGCQNSASENIRVLDLNAAVNSLDASYCYLTGWK
ncbi:MAG: hypothetical protein B7C24_06490 [Bacteroidetes bacterium 4572_77]|nr:MAG: hypothetical protein B7C24_06490 [Bacteroidetes bacterium 4572_77]